MTSDQKKYNERKEILDKLWYGTWKDRDINLSQIFLEDDFRAMLAVAHGCGINGNTDVLYMLFTLINGRFDNPSAELIESREKLEEIIKSSGLYPDMSRMTHKELIEYWNFRVKESCLSIIKEIICAASELSMKDKKAKEMLDYYMKSENRAIRLYVVCNTNNPEIFLHDSDERISKVAFIRSDFAIRWKTMSEQEKQQIEFIVSALKAKVIKCYDGLVGGYPEGYMCALFESILFSKTDYLKFDSDVFNNIRDEHILADEINKLIRDGKICLDAKFKPNFFPNTGEIKKLDKE